MTTDDFFFEVIINPLGRTVPGCDYAVSCSVMIASSTESAINSKVVIASCARRRSVKSVIVTTVP